MAKVKLDQVTKDFGKVRAVDHLTLDIPDGEFLVLLGPSGAGKTTTLKLIAGVETINTGVLTIGDRIMNALEPQKRNVAMAFESYALYPHYSVYDNLAFPLRAPGSKMSRAEVDKRVKEVAELLNIQMLLDRRPVMLSGGQKQRVSLGRALVRTPDVLLLDEPISHLDAKLRHRMRTEFKALESSIQVTTLYVTHDYLEAMSLGDRVAVINYGALQQVGRPEDLFMKPATVFVATMLGQPRVNLVECDVVNREGKLRFVRDDAQLQLTPPPALAQRVTDSGAEKVVVGLRPNFMHAPGSNGNGSAQAALETFPSRVYVYERLGTKGILSVLIGPGDGHRMDVVTPIDMDFDIDQPVSIGVESENMLVFDARTQRNLAL
jgi:multiple sugar transport system ATP-binding protein